MHEESLQDAYKVGFLKEDWEIQLYAECLTQAKLWGEKKTQENKEYFSKNHLIDKYNV